MKKTRQLLFELKYNIYFVWIFFITVNLIWLLFIPKICLDQLTPLKVIVSTWKVHVRTYIQTDRRKFFWLVLSSKTYKSWTFVKRREFIFFHSCDYITFSFYILRMWWESKNLEDVWHVYIPNQKFDSIGISELFVCLFWVLRYTKYESREFFFQSCDYNTFYILRMW